MDIIPYNEARKIWQRIARTTNDLDLPLQPGLHKRFMNIFQVGSYYHYIFNCVSGEIEYADEEITNVLGYTQGEFTVELLISKIHPDDLPYFLNFENEVTNFFRKLTPVQVLKYKVKYDYRVQKKEGNYIRLLQQVITIQSDDDGAVLRTMGVHTDITYFKPDGAPQLSFIGLEGEPSYHDVAAKKVYALAREVLTRREKEILAYMAKGYKSQEISDHLNISTQTVITHRKNMLGKSATGSTAELVVTALKEGWI